jgi:hypothetical protein
MFSRKEAKYLFITILVMTLALGFNDGQPSFDLNYWMGNLVGIFLIVAFSFLIHQIAHKLTARSFHFDTHFKWWGVEYLSPKRGIAKYKKDFPKRVSFFGKKFVIETLPIGIIISLIVMIFSNGHLFFLAIGEYTLVLRRKARFGKKYVHIRDYDDAMIALSGPMSHVFLMFVAAIFNNNGIFDTFIFINSLLALFYMIPIHNLDGAKVLFGSRLLYLSSVIFIVSVTVMIYTLSVIPLLIVAGLITFLVGSLYYYQTIYKSK